MAKADLLKQAQKSGFAPDSATVDDYSEADLRALLGLDQRAEWEGSMSAQKPVVGPDGHVHLSQEDISNRS